MYFSLIVIGYYSTQYTFSLGRGCEYTGRCFCFYVMSGDCGIGHGTVRVLCEVTIVSQAQSISA